MTLRIQEFTTTSFQKLGMPSQQMQTEKTSNALIQPTFVAGLITTKTSFQAHSLLGLLAYMDSCGHLKWYQHRKDEEEWVVEREDELFQSLAFLTTHFLLLSLSAPPSFSASHVRHLSRTQLKKAVHCSRLHQRGTVGPLRLHLEWSDHLKSEYEWASLRGSTIPALNSFIFRSHSSLQAETGGCLDPQPFEDPVSRTRFLVFKADTDHMFTKANQLWICKLSEDGLSLDGDMVPIQSPSQDYQGDVLEAPYLTYHSASNSYCLFYSSGNFSTKGKLSTPFLSTNIFTHFHSNLSFNSRIRHFVCNLSFWHLWALPSVSSSNPQHRYSSKGLWTWRSVYRQRCGRPFIYHLSRFRIRARS